MSSKEHYPFIDGLRGACALYVVLSHACAQVEQTFQGPIEQLNIFNYLCLSVFRFGHFAVGFFIVISGFCIFEKVDSSGRPALTQGFRSYATSRARRILPPYMACLIVYCLLVWVLPDLQQPNGSRWDVALPAFQWDVLLSHFFMIHQLSDQWIFKIDPPMWSLGIEWWIYWIVPALILPIWRKRGAVAGILSGFVWGYGIWILKLMPMNACSWYVGLFCLGMAIPSVKLWSKTPGEVSVLNRWSLGSFVFLSIAVANYLDRPITPFADFFIGLSAFCLILAGLKGGWVRKVFSSSVLTKLGEFSYSIYLFHWIILTLIHNYGLALKMSPNELTDWNLLAGVPLAVAASYLFYLAFERPTLRRRQVARVESASMRAA